MAYSEKHPRNSREHNEVSNRQTASRTEKHPRTREEHYAGEEIVIMDEEHPRNSREILTILKLLERR